MLFFKSLESIAVFAGKLMAIMLISLTFGCAMDTTTPAPEGAASAGESLRAESDAVDLEATVQARVAATRAAQTEAEAATLKEDDMAEAEPAVGEGDESAIAASAVPAGLDLTLLLGQHTFAEADGSGIFITYAIEVFQAQGNWLANIDIDGAQWLKRLVAYGKPTEHGLDFYLDSYREGNSGEPYDQDQYLLSLELWDGERWIYWGAIEPQLTPIPADRYSLIEELSPIETEAGIEPAEVSAGDNASATTEPIVVESIISLPIDAWVDVDGSGIADFWSDSGGVGTRATISEGFGNENYDDVTLSFCTNAKYYGDIPFDPDNRNAFCFATDQGFAGKFRVLSREADGSLAIQYAIWGDPANLTPITDIEPAGQPSSNSARPWPEGSELTTGQINQPPPPPAKPSYAVALGDATYENWGQPQHANGCGGPYFDRHPMRNFKVYVTLTNQGDQTIPDNWAPYFTSTDGETLPSCYWTFNDREVGPGQSTTVVWGTFVEPNDWVTGIHFTEYHQRLSLCFNQAGKEADC